MCQCGCSDLNLQSAYKMRDGTILGYQVYAGCQECSSVIGVDLFFYNSRSSEWLHGMKIADAPTPDKYGGNEGLGLMLPLLDVDEMRTVAKEMEAEGNTVEAYESLDGWLEDNGLELIQETLRRTRKKELEQSAKAVSEAKKKPGRK